MRASDFDFVLPPAQIAQTPAAERDHARLFVVDEADPHRAIPDLPSLLPPGALLVVNDTRVLPARLYGVKPSGGRFELLLVEPVAEAPADGRAHWWALGRASKPFRPGPLALDGEAPPAVELVALRDDRLHVAFAVSPDQLGAVLDRIGHMPLPPYIEKERSESASGDFSALDRERYQTVYAAVPGAIAAPTAGLHFTPRLLAALDARGIERRAITLHVGPGTFAPLRTDEVDTVTQLHTERYDVPVATAAAFARAKAEGRPVVAVGTTVARTLESAVVGGDGSNGPTLRVGPGQTGLFIKPGYAFAAVDVLLTNFHLPRSTLLMLVCALGGTARILAAYAQAVAAGYRFYSYGDAMLVRRSS